MGKIEAMRRSRLLAATAASLALTTGGLAAAAQAAPLGPTFLGGNGKKAKPRSIGVGAKGEFQRLRWRGWGKGSAYAGGVYDIAGFATEPGTGYRSSVRLRVFGLKRCASGKTIYTKVHYRVGKPIGGRRSFAETFARC